MNGSGDNFIDILWTISNKPFKKKFIIINKKTFYALKILKIMNFISLYHFISQHQVGRKPWKREHISLVEGGKVNIFRFSYLIENI